MAETIEVKTTEDPDEIQQSIKLRYEVFILEEARTRTVEADDVDQNCRHIVAVKDGKVIGTLRLYLLEPGDKDIKIGRVAVSKEFRGQGIGTRMMAGAHRWAGTQYPSIYLYSQVGVIGFYEGLGYKTEGEVFEESGTPHIFMRYVPDDVITDDTKNS